MDEVIRDRDIREPLLNITVYPGANEGRDLALRKAARELGLESTIILVFMSFRTQGRMKEAAYGSLLRTPAMVPWQDF